MGKEITATLSLQEITLLAYGRSTDKRDAGPVPPCAWLIYSLILINSQTLQWPTNLEPIPGTVVVAIGTSWWRKYTSKMTARTRRNGIQALRECGLVIDYKRQDGCWVFILPDPDALEKRGFHDAHPDA